MALPDPIAYWPFDNSGTDASGNGHTATLVNGTYDTSALKKFGTAALANTDVSRAASFTAINLGTVHSIAFWMDGWDGLNDGVVVGGIAGNYLYIDTSYVNYGAPGGTFTRASHIPPGGLSGSHHIVLTRNGNSTIFYRDGAALEAASLLTGNPVQTFGSIGGYDSGSLPFVATIDDLRFYDVALSPAQVAELYALVPTSSTESTATPIVGKISAGMVTTFEPNVVAALPCTTVTMYTVDTSAYERSSDPDFTTIIPITFDSNSQAIIAGGHIRNKSASNSDAVFKKHKKK